MNTRGSWRNDPNLQGRFHPDHPNDLQVVVHDGGPQLTNTTPELMWVTVLEKTGAAYAGQILNAPQNLTTVEAGSIILFLALPEVKHPFRVTEEYLAERDAWDIVPCSKCGFPELFDAPSDLMSKVFPDLQPDELVASFTAMCPLCHGIQVVDLKDKSEMEAATSNRKWWQF